MGNQLFGEDCRVDTTIPNIEKGYEKAQLSLKGTQDLENIVGCKRNDKMVYMGKSGSSTKYILDKAKLIENLKILSDKVVSLAQEKRCKILEKNKNLWVNSETNVISFELEFIEKVLLCKKCKTCKMKDIMTMPSSIYKIAED